MTIAHAAACVFSMASSREMLRIERGPEVGMARWRHPLLPSIEQALFQLRGRHLVG